MENIKFFDLLIGSLIWGIPTIFSMGVIAYNAWKLSGLYTLQSQGKLVEGIVTFKYTMQSPGPSAAPHGAGPSINTPLVTAFGLNCKFWDEQGIPHMWRGKRLPPNYATSKKEGDPLSIIYLPRRPSLCFPKDYLSEQQGNYIKWITISLPVGIFCSFALYRIISKLSLFL